MKKKFVNLNILEKGSNTNYTNENELTPFAGHRMKLTDFTIAETDDWIALNKPSGLLSIPDREGKDVSTFQQNKTAITSEQYHNMADKFGIILP